MIRFRETYPYTGKMNRRTNQLFLSKNLIRQLIKMNSTTRSLDKDIITSLKDSDRVYIIGVLELATMPGWAGKTFIRKI